MVENWRQPEYHSQGSGWMDWSALLVRNRFLPHQHGEPRTQTRRTTHRACMIPPVWWSVVSMTTRKAGVGEVITWLELVMRVLSNIAVALKLLTRKKIRLYENWTPEDLLHVLNLHRTISKMISIFLIWEYHVLVLEFFQKLIPHPHPFPLSVCESSHLCASHPWSQPNGDWKYLWGSELS